MKKKIIYLVIILVSLIFLLTSSIFLYSKYINKINFDENIKKATQENNKFNNGIILTSKVNIEAANGKGGVDLDWSSYDKEGKIFKAYQKKEGAEEFESISTVDFYKEIEPIKVLNVYPAYQNSDSGKLIDNVNFSYSNGIKTALQKSAALKVWMEGGTITENGKITTFEAYGKNPITGQQIINVTPISSIDFNNNPNMIWNYDVLMWGTWDGNGGQKSQPNDNTISIIEQYIQEGYGVLIGHDTIIFTSDNTDRYGILRKLRKYFNIDLGYVWEPSKDLTNVDYNNASWWYNSSTIQVNKKGLLTNFPYELPKGAKLIIPETHTSSNAALGNVWMTLVDGIDNYNNAGSINSYYNAGGKGEAKFYLTTWNNTAMIQTGSGNCDSTDDERKVLANTLFYLKQRTTAKAFTDNSSQDLKGPNAPIINNPKKAEDNKIKLTYKAEDKGNTYTYYIESYDKTDSTKVLEISNQVTETVTTGVKGYYYTIDNNNQNTNFDINTATYTENEEIITELSNDGKYIHMKAVDKAGNIGEESTTKIEVIILTSKVNLEIANGKGEIELDWSNYDCTNRYFVIYRKKENETDWKTIVSLKDKLSANTYVDELGNDVNKPNVPSINVKSNQEQNNINITGTSTDIGTKYNYYIESYNINDLSLLSISNQT